MNWRTVRPFEMRADESTATERSPSDPPCPVERGPIVQEAGVRASYPITERPYLGEIDAKAGEHTAENVECWTEYDNRQQQQKGDNYIELAQGV